ncbi:MAG TPA: D-glycero-beta-D-manno-heptose 1-phosphate adenylyltransferase, partial [Burkholderiaceae bacterium]|nr:D-glycero-beta-D-manno-heptose 1-phosphate adenylyltransferase [Burkholderiaceae bacterium]
SVRLLGKGDDRPLNEQFDRAALLAALECVTLVTVFDEEVPIAPLEIARPEIYVKGGDYEIDTIAESAIVRRWGGRTVAMAFEHQRSTTALLQRIRTPAPRPKS